MDYFNSVHRSLRAHATRTRAAACAHRRLSCALSRSGSTTWTRSSTTSTTTPPRAARSSRSTPPRATTPTPSSRPPSRCASRPAPSRRPWPSLRCSFNARHADATRVLMCRPRASGRSATTISSRLATTPTPTGAPPTPPASARRLPQPLPTSQWRLCSYMVCDRQVRLLHLPPGSQAPGPRRDQLPEQRPPDGSHLRRHRRRAQPPVRSTDFYRVPSLFCAASRCVPTARAAAYGWTCFLTFVPRLGFGAHRLRAAVPAALS